jgi:hypothetical protein
MNKIFTTTLIYLTVAVISIISGCKTNPPIAPQEPVYSYGKVFVNSNISGAQIFVDNQNSGKVTPDTIETIIGSRQINLVKEGYTGSSLQVDVLKDSTISINIELEEVTVNKIVLLEDFANVSCVPCVTSNKITHSLSQSYAGKLLIVKFPTNFPKPTDPFYLAAKPDCDARMAYYSIITAPTIIIDGTTRPVSSDSNSIKAAIDNALLEEPAFDITVTDSVYNGTMFITASIAPLNITGIDFNDYVIHTAIVEKRIDTGTPPGSNGETVFYDVTRKMLPSSSGAPMTAANLTGIENYSGQVEISASWNMSEIITVVYIQNKNTRKVLQAASAE